tara:strand:- start:3698 stop:4633 length:936 start_codon:yes stop_codon:yes gene_type:complete
MVEIIHQYKKDWTMFFLASLLDKQDEDWRLHVYIDEVHWKDREVRWMLDNFKRIQIYESHWALDDTAKQLCHLKNWWSDKTPGLGKRLIFANGNRIFNGKVIGNNLPPENFFKKNLSFLSWKKVFNEHPTYKKYYKMLFNAIQPDNPKEFDPEFVIINYDVLKNMTDDELFFKQNPVTGHIDDKISDAGNLTLMRRLMTYSWNSMPVYMNGKNDFLIENDAIGLKDLVNYNVMMRKCYTINLQHKWLVQDYNKLSTGMQLAFPWDMYTSLIDKIPLQFRNHELNEKLLIKGNKQKQVLEKILKVGYRLGKI